MSRASLRYSWPVETLPDSLNALRRTFLAGVLRGAALLLRLPGYARQSLHLLTVPNVVAHA